VNERVEVAPFAMVALRCALRRFHHRDSLGYLAESGTHHSPIVQGASDGGYYIEALSDVSWSSEKRWTLLRKFGGQDAYWN